MGGNALKHTEIRRVPADEYFTLWHEIYQSMREKIWQSRIEVELIPAYTEKADFGDMDILWTDVGQPWTDKMVYGQKVSNMKDIVRAVFSPNEIVTNGIVTSFDYKGMQVDMIHSSREDFDYAYQYYSFNDLGNLVGKLARRFGMKHGHDGLWLPIRDGDYHVGDISLTKNWQKTYEFLGLSTDIESFDNLEQIFRFVASSPYYDPDLYTLENLSHTAKVRDRKRETYRKFLEFGENYDGPVCTMSPDKKFYLPMVLEYFGKQAEFKTMMEQVSLHRAAREVFDGEIVAKVTGLEGKALGEFMRHLKSLPKFAPEMVVYFGATRVIDNIHDVFNDWRSQ